MRQSLSHAATTVILALVLLASCHSHKEVASSTKEQYDIEAAGSVTTSTAERFQWLSRLSLDIDSFEVIIPTDHFAEIGKMDSVTAMELPEQFAISAGQPRSRSVVLRGKHASIGKADIVQRNAARCTSQVDTLSAHHSMDKADHYARDNVGIAKPPDVTWWPWLLLAGLLVGFWLIIWLKDK